MAFPIMNQGGVELRMQYERMSKTLKPLYSIASHRTEVMAYMFPGKKTRLRLARKFKMEGYRELTHESRADLRVLFFEIDSYVPVEDRAAFLAAFCVHTHVTEPSSPSTEHA